MSRKVTPYASLDALDISLERLGVREEVLHDRDVKFWAVVHGGWEIAAGKCNDKCD